MPLEGIGTVVAGDARAQEPPNPPPRPPTQAPARGRQHEGRVEPPQHPPPPRRRHEELEPGHGVARTQTSRHLHQRCPRVVDISQQVGERHGIERCLAERQLLRPADDKRDVVRQAGGPDVADLLAQHRLVQVDTHDPAAGPIGDGCGSSGVTTRSVTHLARAPARGPCLLLPLPATGAFAGRVAPAGPRCRCGRWERDRWLDRWLQVATRVATWSHRSSHRWSGLRGHSERATPIDDRERDAGRM